MIIKNARIDDSLIHGQVAVRWSRALKVTRIIVVDRDVLNNNMQKTMLKMACPQGIKLSILDPITAASNLKDEKYAEDTIMMVARTPQSYLELINEGYQLETITVGNMSRRNDTRVVFKTVSVTRQEEEAFHQLMQLGVKIYYQMLDSDEPADFIELMDKR